jgi:hypothetical protein
MTSCWMLCGRGWKCIRQRFDTARSGWGWVYEHGKELGVGATDSVVDTWSLGILGLRACCILIYQCSVDVRAGVQ